MKNRKTSCRDEIKKLTGCTIGKIFYDNLEYPVYMDEDYIYQIGNCNFHLLPEIKSDNDRLIWNEYIENIKNIRTNLINILKEKNIEVLGCGENGNISPKLEKYGKTNFFRCIIVKKNNRYYAINFIRWYIGKNRSVNCEYGELQFDSTLDCCVNHENIITYPEENECRQQLEKVKFDQYGGCIYNPVELNGALRSQGKEREQREKDIVKSFLNFINKVEELQES